jgi:hypothetical protein
MATPYRITGPTNKLTYLVSMSYAAYGRHVIQGAKILHDLFDGDDTLLSALVEPGVSSTRPRKQDSASVRSDSSSAIQRSGNTNKLWNKVL